MSKQESTQRWNQYGYKQAVLSCDLAVKKKTKTKIKTQTKRNPFTAFSGYIFHQLSAYTLFQDNMFCCFSLQRLTIS